MLSNLFPHKFTMHTKYDAIEFNCMEAFLRALCWNGSEIGIISEVAKLHGEDVFCVSNVLPDWCNTQVLYWNCEPYHRESGAYHKLIEMAFDRLFDSSALFREALKKTKGKILICSEGESDPKVTLLTKNEYLSMLERERNRLTR